MLPANWECDAPAAGTRAALDCDSNRVLKHTSPPQPDKRTRRPPGKRSDPNYEQVTAYVRKETYAAVKRKLFLEENEREFSDLIEELLGFGATE